MKDLEKCEEYEEFSEKLFYKLELFENRGRILNNREEKISISKTDLSKSSTFSYVINLFKISWSTV
jgi:hypothetical protein